MVDGSNAVKENVLLGSIAIRRQPLSCCSTRKIFALRKSCLLFRQLVIHHVDVFLLLPTMEWELARRKSNDVSKKQKIPKNDVIHS